MTVGLGDDLSPGQVGARPAGSLGEELRQRADL